MNADGTPADARSRVRLLAIAYLAVFAHFLSSPELPSQSSAIRAAASRSCVSTFPKDFLARNQPSMHTQAPAAAATTPQIPATIVQPIYAGTALVADPALIETTDNGPLPRIGADGRTPLQAYAAPVSDATKPRIAIVISGLGISAKATAAALAKLPPQVTLAFAPYAADVQTWVTQARRQGHEVLLEVPMEPFDFPDSDPGPHTLRSGVAEDANTERLVWALTRFTGYTGVTNLLGGRLLSDSEFAGACPHLSRAPRTSLLRQWRGHPFRWRLMSPAAPASPLRKRRSPSIRFRPPWKSTMNCPNSKPRRVPTVRRPAQASFIRSRSTAWHNGHRASAAGALFWCPHRP